MAADDTRKLDPVENGGAAPDAAHGDLDRTQQAPARPAGEASTPESFVTFGEGAQGDSGMAAAPRRATGRPVPSWERSRSAAVVPGRSPSAAASPSIRRMTGPGPSRGSSRPRRRLRTPRPPGAARRRRPMPPSPPTTRRGTLRTAPPTPPPPTPPGQRCRSLRRRLRLHGHGRRFHLRRFLVTLLVLLGRGFVQLLRRLPGVDRRSRRPRPTTGGDPVTVTVTISSPTSWAGASPVAGPSRSRRAPRPTTPCAPAASR